VGFLNLGMLPTPTYVCGLLPSGLDTCLLQPGDIILGNQPLDGTLQFLRSVATTYWWHAAIYLGNGDVAEATAGADIAPIDQILVRSVSDYFGRASLTDWAIIRPNVTSTQRAVLFARTKADQINPPASYITSIADFKKKDFATDQYYCTQFVGRRTKSKA